jgi:N-acetylneuraminate synthase
MSTLKEIDKAVEFLGTDKLILYHCTSTYPTQNNEINLKVIPELKKRYNCLVGYSGHERGIAPSTIAAAMGACSIERHITLDRTMWGSDQAASLEGEGLRKLVRDIRNVKDFLGDGKKCVYKSEIPIKEKLRR